MQMMEAMKGKPFQPTPLAARELLAQHHERLAQQDRVFVLASVFSGMDQQAGYFARCLAQRVRSARLLRELGPEHELVHKQWTLAQAKRLQEVDQ